MLKKNEKLVVSKNVTFDVSCTEKVTGSDDDQKFMKFVLEAKDGNVTIDGKKVEHSVHNPENQLPDPMNNEEQNVMHPVDLEGQNTEVTLPPNGGNENSDIDM